MATYVRDSLMVNNALQFIDGEADEFYEIADITQEGSVLTITTYNVSRTRTIVFTVAVHGGN